MDHDTHNIIINWFKNISRSVTRRDLPMHMSLVSEKVRVYGIPGFDSLTFLDWEKRRRHEFKHDLIQTLTYKLNRVVTSTPRRISFVAEETMRAMSGQVIILNKDITLEQHPDTLVWQVVEENIRDWNIHQ